MVVNQSSSKLVIRQSRAAGLRKKGVWEFGDHACSACASQRHPRSVASSRWNSVPCFLRVGYKFSAWDVYNHVEQGSPIRVQSTAVDIPQNFGRSTFNNRHGIPERHIIGICKETKEDYGMCTLRSK